MRLTKKGKYAVSAMLDIALFEDKEKSFVKIQDISKRQRIPNSYLEQILRNLRQEGLLLSVTGPNGGYRLSRDSAHISIADIVMSIEDRLDSTECGGTADCLLGEECLSHNLWSQLNNELESFLKNKSLADVLEKNKKKPLKISSGDNKNLIAVG